MSSQFVIRKIGREYSEEMLQLFNTVFNKKCDINFWLKKHFENPIGETIFWGVFDEEELIAINGFMPMKFKHENTEYYVLQSCESAVKSEYRHRGLFSQLICSAVEWAEDNDIDFFIGMPNMFSCPGFLKMDWNVVGTAETYSKIVSLSKWFNSKKNFRPIADLYVIVAYFLFFLTRRSSSCTIKKIGIDEFLKIHKNDNKYVDCCLSKEFLEWKLDQNDNIYLTSCDNQYVLLTVVRDNYIIYYEHFSDNRGCLERAWREMAKRTNPSNGLLTVYSESHKDIQDVLLRSGFVTRREPPYNRIAKIISAKANNVLAYGILINELERD